MTTTVKVHVNGRYRATVTQVFTSPGYKPTVTVVEGNYEGSPNPTGEASFYLPHPAAATFVVTEEYIGDKV